MEQLTSPVDDNFISAKLVQQFKSEKKIRKCLNSIDNRCAVINVENSDDEKYKRNIEEVHQLSLKWIGEKIKMWKDILQQYRIKEKLKELFKILLVVLGLLCLMWVQITLKNISQNVNLLK